MIHVVSSSDFWLLLLTSGFVIWFLLLVASGVFFCPMVSYVFWRLLMVSVSGFWVLLVSDILLWVLLVSGFFFGRMASYSGSCF